MTTATTKKIIIIAGPNGAGKTTFANEFLPNEANCINFVNADLIAAGISPTCLFAAPALILGPSNAGGSAFGVIMTGRSTGVLLGPILLPPVLLAMGAWRDIGPIFGGVSLAATLVTLGLIAVLTRRGGDKRTA